MLIGVHLRVIQGTRLPCSLVFLLVLLACTDQSPSDAGGTDVGRADAGRADASPADAGDGLAMVFTNGRASLFGICGSPPPSCDEPGWDKYKRCVVAACGEWA
jgi:hypothetical protein